MGRPHIAFTCLVGAYLAFAATCVAQDVRSPKQDMTKKVEYSKNILAGLVAEDFDLIAKNAEALNELGKRRWLENESSDYRTQHQVFWFTNEALIDAAKDESIDGATLAYTQMTFSCVNCHKLLRKQ